MRQCDRVTTFSLVLLVVRSYLRMTGIADQQLLLAMNSQIICTSDDLL